VTGNAGKLREVREILAQGTPIEIESRDLDRECELTYSCGFSQASSLSLHHTMAQSLARPTPLFYDNHGFFFLNHKLGVQFCFDWNIIVPEIQGTTQEVATEKCRHAAELVREFHLSLFSSPPPSPITTPKAHCAGDTLTQPRLPFHISI
jgi:hypothetical protein